MPQGMSIENVVNGWKIEDLQAQKEVHQEKTQDALEQVSAFVLSKAVEAPDYPERRRADAQCHVHLHVVLVVDLTEEQVAGVIEAERDDQKQERRLNVFALTEQGELVQQLDDRERESGGHEEKRREVVHFLGQVERETTGDQVRIKDAHSQKVRDQFNCFYLGKREILAMEHGRPDPGIQSSQSVQGDQKELLIDRTQPAELGQLEFRVLSIFERRPGRIFAELHPSGEVDKKVHQREDGRRWLLYAKVPFEGPLRGRQTVRTNLIRLESN